MELFFELCLVLSGRFERVRFCEGVLSSRKRGRYEYSGYGKRSMKGRKIESGSELAALLYL